MADPRFFTNKGPFTLGQLAEITGSELQGGDAALAVSDVASLDQAGEGQVSFLDNVKYRDQFTQTKAAGCFIHPKMVELAPAHCALLVSPQPYKAYALAAQAFYPETVPAQNIHAGAHIAESAKIGEGCWIEAGAVIGENVEIGDHCRIGANAVISHAIIGNHVRIYRGASIGQDGFGFAIDPAGHVKVPQLGRVIIEDGVQVGANTCIDRGAGPDTVIGAGTWLDNLIQIGHNVQMGRGCIIAAQVGISGSTTLGDFVAMGGQSGIAGHLTIGMAARIGAQAGVMRDVPAGEEHIGFPAMKSKQFMRQVVALSRLIKPKN